MLMLTDALLVLCGYLLGSISTAIVVCRIMGLPDPRTSGSRNPGATNVLRMGSKTGAGLALAGDALKGVIAVLIARAVGAEPLTLALVAYAAFLGHLYPVFFRFQGGKGVATALGIWLVIAWPVGLAVIATWLIMALLFRISSLSALTAAALSPVYMWLLEPVAAYVVMSAAIAVLLFWRHRGNIQRLLAGEEPTIGYRDRK